MGVDRSRGSIVVVLNRCVRALAAAVVLAGPLAAASQAGAQTLGSCATTVSQHAVAGDALKQMTVTITADAGPAFGECSLSQVTGSATGATSVASVIGPLPCTVTTSKARISDGFSCHFVGIAHVEIVVVYGGPRGGPATSTVTAKGTAGSRTSQVAGAFDPASLTVTHQQGTTAGGATDRIAFTNQGGTSLSSVQLSDDISAGTLTSVKIASSLPATCGLANGERVCTLKDPLPAGATWRVRITIIGTPGATDKNSAKVMFLTRSVDGRNLAKASGPLGS